MSKQYKRTKTGNFIYGMKLSFNRGRSWEHYWYEDKTIRDNRVVEWKQSGQADRVEAIG